MATRRNWFACQNPACGYSWSEREVELAEKSEVAQDSA
jgi:hypothetical protein